MATTAWRTRVDPEVNVSRIRHYLVGFADLLFIKFAFYVSRLFVGEPNCTDRTLRLSLSITYMHH